MADKTTAPESGGAATGPLAACWSCKGPVAAAALFCHVCGAVQPPREVDAYTRLGFEPRFDIDPAELDKRYLGFQRNLHPDRFARKSPREKAIAESQAMSLNEAYETLKDAVRRAQALLARAGIASPVGESRTIEDRELLMEAMEVREALEEAADLDALQRLASRAQQEEAGCLKALTAAFAERDWDEAARQTTRLKYWRKFAEELRGKRAVLAGASS
ncbi:MAG TPA: Fe-S protein assembly co-chaperone HscB [Hypericibacter adhaerens]|nr:Fe-S protein assembly co-chaperone HscB [Hypericibacter adhaerens]HWA45561.1 Fe-S protein assembly co-chaperone HscB [Hypericibacter adhaerens]